MRELTYKIAEDSHDVNGSNDVRRRVFVEEQGISELLVFNGCESDDEMNIVAKGGESIIGTARVVFPDINVAKIERMAVIKSFRHRGIGSGIVNFIIGELKNRQIKYVILHAQHTAVEFYKSCGFKESGRPFLEAGIKHVKMEMKC